MPLEAPRPKQGRADLGASSLQSFTESLCIPVEVASAGDTAWQSRISKPKERALSTQEELLVICFLRYYYRTAGRPENPHLLFTTLDSLLNPSEPYYFLL